MGNVSCRKNYYAWLIRSYFWKRIDGVAAQESRTFINYYYSIRIYKYGTPFQSIEGIINSSFSACAVLNDWCDWGHLYCLWLVLRHNKLHRIRFLRRPHQEQSSPRVQCRPTRLPILQNLHVSRDRHLHATPLRSRLLLHSVWHRIGFVLGSCGRCCSTCSAECGPGFITGVVE